MRIKLQPAYVLHQRPYRETSVLVELFTQNYGRISAVARGVRQQSSRWRPLIQPFVPLLVDWQGRNDLMTLTSVESQGHSLRLQGDCLLSGFYLNELLIRVLQKQDPYPTLYTIYHHTLLKLQRLPLSQEVLRIFEKKLLEEIGYALQLQHAVNKEPLEEDKFYRFHVEHGFEECPNVSEPLSATIFAGSSLLALAKEQLIDAECLRDAKRLMRIALGPLIGSYELQSRKLFKQVEKI